MTDATAATCAANETAAQALPLDDPADLARGASPLATQASQ